MILGMDTATVAYLAAIIDTQGVIRTRTTRDGTELPYVAVSGSNEAMLRFLAEVTGTRVTITRRSYGKAGCSEHCPDKHQHVQSVSGRWSVSGAKATVLLHNVRPFLRLQGDEARSALVVGVGAPFKPATVAKMRDLGWELPAFSPGGR